MVKVNVTKLQDILSEVSSELDNYKAVFALIKAEYEIMKPVWINGVGDQFFNTTDDNIKNTILTIQSFETFINDMKVLAGNYASLGTTISCNLDKKSSVLQKYDVAISKVEAAANSYNHLGSTYFYPHNGRLNSEQNRLEGVASKLKKYQSTTKKVFNRVDNYEKSIRGRLRKEQLVKINNDNTFDGPITHASWAEFKVNEVRASGSKIFGYTSVQKDSITKIKGLLSSLSSAYSSENFELVNKVVCIIISSLTNSNNNDEYYSNFISRYCEEYDAMKAANMNNLERPV